MSKISKATTEKRQELGKIIPLNVPFTCDIYPTNACNFRCKYCSHSVKDKTVKNEYMTWELYKKCIDDLKGFSSPVKQIVFVGIGEPLLHPDIVNMVDYAKKSHIAERVSIISNGSLLSHEISDGLIKAGLDHLKISIQALNNNMYKEISGTNYHLEDIISNIRYFYTHKEHTEVDVKIIDESIDRANGETEELFYEMFDDISDIMHIEYLCKYQENVDYSFLEKDGRTQTGEKAINHICQLPFFRYAVYPDGSIIPCCHISFNSYKKITIGNVKSDNLCDIWNSKKFNRMRLMILEDQRDMNEVCKSCDIFFQSQCQPGDNIDPYVDELILKYKKLLGDN